MPVFEVGNVYRFWTSKGGPRQYVHHAMPIVEINSFHALARRWTEKVISWTLTDYDFRIEPNPEQITPISLA
jgi:beta-glucanase (GH16 family)